MGRKSGDSAEAADASLALGVLGDAIAFHLRLAQDASFQNFAREIGNADIRPGRYALLSLIEQNPNTNQKALSEVSGRDKSTLSLALADLEKRGLVARSRSPEDRRTMVLNLTPLGGETLAALREAARKHDAALNRIVGDRKAAFLATLKDIVAALGRGRDA